MRRIAYLDGWRGCAVLAVLFGHFVSDRGIGLGRVGVELFFVLSGRLMAEILFREQVPLLGFYKRRFSRIYPALIAFVLCALAIPLIMPVPRPSGGQYLAAATLTANYAQLWIGRTPILDHIWSLCVEEHMYLLLGVIAITSRRFKFRAIHPIIAIAVAFMLNGALLTYLGRDYYSVYWRSDVRGASILIGAASYLVLDDYRGARFGYAGTLSFALIVLGLTLSVNKVPDSVKYSFGTGAFAAALSLMPISVNGLRRALSIRALTYVGTLSYSLYLWQQPFANAQFAGLPKAALLPVVLALAMLSYTIIEQPARKLLNRILHARSAAHIEGTAGSDR